MRYRKFGELDWKPSALGFGMMRLPTVKEEYSGTIDEETSMKMAKIAIENGVNYFDTAWPYHSGVSEQFVGKLLQKDKYRDKIRVATKMPGWKVDEDEDLDHYFEKQLKILNVDSIDFYLLHGLSKERWGDYKEVNVFDWMDKKRAEGKIKNMGFSFHDDLETFKSIVDSYEWDFCQIQYNYLDQVYQAGTEGLKYAADNGLGVVIMEGLRGGQLAKEPPQSIKEIWNKADVEWPPVEWALRWLWNQPEVSLVLSGMSEISHVKENVKIADRGGINTLTDKQLRIINEVKEKFDELSPIDCTGCNYCMPCPNDVLIPTNFEYYNNAHLYDEYDKYKEYYYNRDEKNRASSCVACGECEEKCPQHLPIIDLMEKVANYFEDTNE